MPTAPTLARRLLLNSSQLAAGNAGPWASAQLERIVLGVAQHDGGPVASDSLPPLTQQSTHMQRTPPAGVGPAGQHGGTKGNLAESVNFKPGRT